MKFVNITSSDVLQSNAAEEKLKVIFHIFYSSIPYRFFLKMFVEIQAHILSIENI